MSFNTFKCIPIFSVGIALWFEFLEEGNSFLNLQKYMNKKESLAYWLLGRIQNLITCMIRLCLL
jgi:hypothetical protein